jgi:hypothetical protein
VRSFVDEDNKRRREKKKSAWGLKEKLDMELVFPSKEKLAFQGKSTARVEARAQHGASSGC